MEQLKHECGVAMIRLLKPLAYYEQKYGTWRYGLDKLYLLMEKQHNRGQEGAGVACVNMDAPVGMPLQRFSISWMTLLRDSSIWVIYAIPLQARVDYNMCILFYVVIIGERKTSVCVETSI